MYRQVMRRKKKSQYFLNFIYINKFYILLVNNAYMVNKYLCFPIYKLITSSKIDLEDSYSSLFGIMV